MKFIRVGLAVVGVIGLLSSYAWADTAFQMQAVAEGVVSPHVRGKLIWVRSIGGKGANPEKWSFLFYDPYADQNGRAVEVGNGAVSKVEQGFVELDRARLIAYKKSEVMPAAKLKFDSDRALAAVQSAAKIENVALSTVKYELKMSDDNDVPVWKLTLYTMSGDDELKVCTARVSAFTGQIFSLDVERGNL